LFGFQKSGVVKLPQIIHDISNEIQITQILQIGAQWLGLQRTAGTVLTILYRGESSQGLSVNEISLATELSLSTVSSVCSQLESLGILMRRSNSNQQGRGRRKAIFVMCVGIHDMLKMGIRRRMDQVGRISRDLDQILIDLKHGNPNEYAKVARAADEISIFLSNRNWQSVFALACTLSGIALLQDMLRQFWRF